MLFADLFKIHRNDDRTPIPILLLMVLLFALFTFKMFDG
ncbi:hypothetical protein JBW_04084 [Pelosinus fermentans JBW45]|uniref:Uncharacterized protein n=1 Tax=Pelosinus fermentans JBW45 TaxID=1192197 RepID=I8U108_9FIRM|nr:hypothetical protein JBW_04084 [Pelosinus fermentans JBW45]